MISQENWRTPEKALRAGSLYSRRPDVTACSKLSTCLAKQQEGPSRRRLVAEHSSPRLDRLPETTLGDNLALSLMSALRNQARKGFGRALHNSLRTHRDT